MKIICIENSIAEKNAHGLQFIFKPETALIHSHLPFFIPDDSTEVTCAVTLVLRICKIGKHIHEKFAPSYFDQITVGIDFTAEDVLKTKQTFLLPTTEARAFDGSATIGKFIAIKNLKDDTIPFSLLKNGGMEQQASISDLPYSFAEIISYVSRFTMLKIGDYIFTGFVKKTSIDPDDLLEAYIGNDKMLKVKIK